MLDGCAVGVCGLGVVVGVLWRRGGTPRAKRGGVCSLPANRALSPQRRVARVWLHTSPQRRAPAVVWVSSLVLRRRWEVSPSPTGPKACLAPPLPVSGAPPLLQPARGQRLRNGRSWEDRLARGGSASRGPRRYRLRPLPLRPRRRLPLPPPRPPRNCGDSRAQPLPRLGLPPLPTRGARPERRSARALAAPPPHRRTKPPTVRGSQRMPGREGTGGGQHVRVRGWGWESE